MKMIMITADSERILTHFKKSDQYPKTPQEWEIFYDGYEQMKKFAVEFDYKDKYEFVTVECFYFKDVVITKKFIKFIKMHFVPIDRDSSFRFLFLDGGGNFE